MEGENIRTSNVVKWILYVFLGGLLIGFIILGWVKILGPMFNQADYNNDNTSPQHLNAIARQLATDCQQLAEATDITTKKAIENDIYQAVSGIDLNTLQLPSYTRTCVTHAINDVGH